MGAPETPISAFFLICEGDRPCNWRMLSRWFHQRVRPFPLLPPLGETGFGPSMLISVS